MSRQDTLLRRQAMLDYDTQKRLQSGVICGVDEAGRGPLAGEVYAAAVILGEDHGIDGLDDSKKLSEKRREALFPEIQEKAQAFCIAAASVEEIERLNILGAAMLAMQRAVEGLGTVPALALVDGNRAPVLPCPLETVVKGDATSASIAAASILAKVARDHYMLKMDALYPEYGFAQHKGYGTAAHTAALRQYGPCPIHRPSFLRKLL
ncbi:MAG: ribonuclease HII [Oscillospiraceae bacterium]|nr:ribonuclease HII [Oscillospiraceae bacterium]